LKKLINDPRDVLREMLDGLVAVDPGLSLIGGNNVVLRADIPSDPASREVALISGGGSGHEPAHAGYVGHGMLSAAVVGDVFTSPGTDDVLAAIRACAGPAGALLIVKNYTGDRLNFGLAAELARNEGIPVEMVIVADDVGLRDTVPVTQRRGIAGTVLVHKIAGAVAAAGRSLEEIAALAKRVALAVGTMGVGLGPCIVPAAGRAGFQLGTNEIEFGLGIHGEKGVRRATIEAADRVVETILQALLDELRLASGQKVALLVNGLGGTTNMELAVVTRSVLGRLADTGVVVERAWTGMFMTALEMPGCSISLLPVDGELIELLDTPTGARAWPGGGRIQLVAQPVTVASRPLEQRAARPGPFSDRLRGVVARIAEAMEQVEPLLTELDSHAGDGDLGASMMRGATALRALDRSSYDNPEVLLTDIANGLRRAIAGSSGPFYAVAALRAAHTLAGHERPREEEWLGAFDAAISAIQDLGGAKAGDRSMLDALLPASRAWHSEGWDAAVKAASAGAQSTATMQPRVGRASYLGQRAVGVPDGGAVAVATWMQAVHEAL
jgi:ATP-dependent dihydroxyacetone kinase